MLFKTMLATTLALLGAPLLALASPAAPIATRDEEVPYSFGVFVYNETDPAPSKVAGPAKRDFCGYGTNFNNADMNSLVNWLQNTNPWDQTYMPHQSVAWWKWGTAQICLQNEYIFENTHVSRWEAGWAISYIRDNLNCCSGGNTCSGGQCTAHGDSGLNLDAVLLHSNYACTLFL